MSSLGRACQYENDDCFLNCFLLDGSWAGQLDKRRAAQNLTWLQEMTQDYLMNLFLRDEAVSAAREEVEAQVRAGTLAPTKALSLIAEALDKRFKGE